MFCVTEQEAGIQSLVTGPQSSGEPPNHHEQQQISNPISSIF